jgi:hypothetical protein
MSSLNITSGTPAEKLSKLTANIHNLLQEVNNPVESPHPFDTPDLTSAQRDRFSDIRRYFNEQQSLINELLTMINTESPPHDTR